MSKAQPKTQHPSNFTLPTFLSAAFAAAKHKQNAAFAKINAKLTDNQLPHR
jgi:hypothetical protein